MKYILDNAIVFAIYLGKRIWISIFFTINKLFILIHSLFSYNTECITVCERMGEISSIFKDICKIELKESILMNQILHFNISRLYSSSFNKLYDEFSSKVRQFRTDMNIVSQDKIYDRYGSDYISYLHNQYKYIEELYMKLKVIE